MLRAVPGVLRMGSYDSIARIIWCPLEGYADALDDLRRSTQPMSILVGASDEFLLAERYPALVRDARSDVAVEVIPGLGHTELVTQSVGLEAITVAVTRNGPSPRRAAAL